MKTIKTILISITALFTLASCSNFLDIKPTDKITAESLFASEGGIQAFLANLYYQMPIESFEWCYSNGFHYNGGDPNNNGNFTWNSTDDSVGSQGYNILGAGSNQYWDAAYKLNNNVNSFFGYIEGLQGFPQETIDLLNGEAWFIRGQVYFALAKRYGGVPIIEKVGDITDSTTLYIPRSTEVATWDYVLECFQNAADLLGDGNANHTRASKWAALAYKSRAALFAASLAKYWDKAPLSGNAVSQGLVGGFTAADAQRYYKACIDASAQIINSGKFSLYKPNPANPEEAGKNYTDIFATPSVATSEIIFLKAYSKVGSGYGHNMDNWNTPAQTAGPWPHPGRTNPTLEWAENFETYSNPGKSVKFQTYPNDAYDYGPYQKNRQYFQFDDPTEMFADKDARLGATAILPNTEWKNTKIVIQGGIIQTNGTPVMNNDAQIAKGYTGSDGKTYYAFGGSSQIAFSGFSTNGGNNTRTGFGCRKFLDPNYEPKGATWNQSTNDWIDMRYPEVMLNYAEAYAESGQGDASTAKMCVNATRHRAAFTNEVEPTLENVLRERRAEFGLGNTRFWDLIRRRMYHEIFSNYRRGALRPVLDLRTMKYIFVRQYLNTTETEVKLGGQTFQTKAYYTSIPNTASNGLVQNPQY